MFGREDLVRVDVQYPACGDVTEGQVAVVREVFRHVVCTTCTSGRIRPARSSVASVEPESISRQ